MYSLGGYFVEDMDIPKGLTVVDPEELEELRKHRFFYIGRSNEVDANEVGMKGFIRYVKVRREGVPGEAIACFAKDFTTDQKKRVRIDGNLTELLYNRPRYNDGLKQWLAEVTATTNNLMTFPDNIHPYPNDEDIYVQE